jgi:hypothetical protein
LQGGTGILLNKFSCGVVNKNYCFGCGGLFDPLAVAVVIIGSDCGVVAVFDEGLLVLGVEGKCPALGVGDYVSGEIVGISLSARETVVVCRNGRVALLLRAAS